MSAKNTKIIWIRFLAVVVAIVSVLVFLALFFIDYGDGTEACHKLGGTTWDYGQHCVIGDFEVVDTN
ncbi:hypothetical protein SEA_ODESZA_73 [Gordonia Phage Odesza]|uniref:Membrane protein n=4 Tax=Tanisvirus tanis TaxID=2844677 RepID=A0A5P8D9I6_9CAUD|nr:membrane protein [Gordonia phage Tanis]AVO25312.1 hypothetical protein PBI_GRAVY_73 [Gordonia phage Gravy]AVO25405.1 hypothetical protein PBI_KERRY_73 [Gordonia phage Kerry]QGJ89683.1 hypothetical protein SEA_ODESZA_73 [Gordonia Phage Odesza]QKY78744.1 hypothetical protein SEA_GILL_74 [Gordonia phage Gill]QYW00712.1 membrane protein [Gordonia phage Roney]